MKVFLVDFDGTLVDSVPALYRVYLQFLQDHEIQGTAQEFKACCGMTIPQFVEFLAMRYSITGSLSHHVNHYYDAVADVYRHQIALFPGARQVLDKAKAKGIRLAVVTASQEPLVNAFLAAHGLNDLFEYVITATGLPASKPDPAIYRRAVQTMQVTPTDCLAIEDSQQGVAAALGAGIPTIAFGAHWHDTIPNAAKRAKTWNDCERYVC